MSVIDGGRLEVVATVRTGVRPRDMRWTPDKARLLVAASGSDRIEILDVESLEIVGEIEAGEDPEIFALDPSGRSSSPPTRTTTRSPVTDLETGEALRTIEDVGIEPEGVTFRHDGKVVFVTSEVTNTVLVVDPWEGRSSTKCWSATGRAAGSSLRTTGNTG